MNNCKKCDKSTTNPKFCSRSCANAYNNKHLPKRQLEGNCSVCQTLISRRHKYCKLCRIEKFSAKDISLLDAKYPHHTSARYAKVRDRARRKVINLGWLSCNQCGYDKHIEACHIKPISSYSGETMISEINREENLIALCPNCHWEFDHGLLKLKTKQPN